MRSREAAGRLLPAAVAAGCLLVSPLLASQARVVGGSARGLPTCLVHLPEAGPEAQLWCLRKLRAVGPAASAAVRPLCDFLAGSDGTTDDRAIAAAFDVLRALGPKAAPAAETLSGLLQHRSRLYRERDKTFVVRLRAYLVVTLGEIGIPASALPSLLDMAAHMDDRLTPLEVGAAVRAIGALGPRGREFVPYLLDAFTQRLSPEEFSLERYEPRFPPEEATTVQLETVRALARVGSAEDRQVLMLLQELAGDRGGGEVDSRVAREARHALELLRARPPGPPGPPLDTAWTPAGRRSRLRNLDIAFKDQDGRPGVLGNLVDRPVLITFFYTRCQNGRKCSLAVSRLAALQRQLVRAGIDDRVRLLAITYEPQFDTPERIHRYATDRGLELGDNALALQLDSERQQRWIDELQAPVNYNAGWVNTHGVELSLLDAGGRLVRQYHTLLWDNDRVEEDVRRVLSE